MPKERIIDVGFPQVMEEIFEVVKEEFIEGVAHSPGAGAELYSGANHRRAYYTNSREPS